MRPRLPLVVLLAVLAGASSVFGGVHSSAELPTAASAEAVAAGGGFEYCFWNEGATYLARPATHPVGAGLAAQPPLVRALQARESTETFTGLQPVAGLPNASTAGEGNFSVAMVPEPSTWMAGTGLLVVAALAVRRARRVAVG